MKRRSLLATLILVGCRAPKSIEPAPLREESDLVPVLRMDWGCGCYNVYHGVDEEKKHTNGLIETFLNCAHHKAIWNLQVGKGDPKFDLAKKLESKA